MLLAILLAEIVMVVYLTGLLIVAVGVTTRHGDPTATYRLYAIRDQLISSVVFGGIHRDNPWLIAFYENVNRVLLHSNLFGGPAGWSRAAAVGHWRINPAKPAELQPFPADFQECPEQLWALAPELRAALKHLLRDHLGLGIYITAQDRQRRRIQRENAKALLRLMASNAAG